MERPRVALTKTVLPVLAGALLLSACGGGGAKSTPDQSNAPTAAPTIAATPLATNTPLAAAATPTQAVPVFGSTPDPRFAFARSVLLAQPELPDGFVKTGEFANNPGEAGEISSSGNLFLQSAQGAPGGSAIVIMDDLDVFKDEASAAKGFIGVVSEPASNVGGITLYRDRLPAEQGPQVGDQTISFAVTGTQSNTKFDGYVVIFRQGRFAVTLLELARPGPVSVEQLASVAQAQANKLKQAGQP